MAFWGAGGDSSHENTRADYTGAVFSGGTFDASDGTLYEFSFYANGVWTSEAWRLAVYQGGASNSDPTGATLIWDSGSIATDMPNTGHVYYGARASLGLNPTGALTASARTFLCFKNDSNVSFGLDSADAGSLGPSYRSTAVSGDPTVAFPSTWPTESSGNSAEALKFRIEYTPVAGGSVLTFQRDLSGGMQNLTGGMSG